MSEQESDHIVTVQEDGGDDFYEDSDDEKEEAPEPVRQQEEEQEQQQQQQAIEEEEKEEEEELRQAKQIQQQQESRVEQVEDDDDDGFFEEDDEEKGQERIEGGGGGRRKAGPNSVLGILYVLSALGLYVFIAGCILLGQPNADVAAGLSFLSIFFTVGKIGLEMSKWDIPPFVDILLAVSLVLLWVGGVFVYTFASPFAFPGTGYFASWLCLVLSAYYVSSFRF